MSKKEFLDKVEYLLRDIPREEREEAMQYYRSYFEDAGIEKEQSIIEELGSPEKVADAVKADFSSAPVVYEKKTFEGKSKEEKSDTGKIWKVALIVVVIVAALPVIFTAGSFLFGILMSVFGAFIGIAVLLFLILGSSLVILFKGISLTAAATGLGLMLAGGGILGIVFSVVVFAGIIKIVVMLFPFLIRKLKQLYQWAKRKIGGL